MIDNLTQNARALRREMTKEERRLWFEFLRDYPLRFMRQRPVDRYIVDFYCAKAKLAVELDGGQHFESEGRRYDAERDAALAAYGIMVLRIPNNEVTQNFAGVCEYIDAAVRRRAPTGSLSKRELRHRRCRRQKKAGRNFRSRAIGGPSERRAGNGKCGKAGRRLSPQGD